MQIKEGNEILNMKYSPTGKLIIELRDIPDNGVAEQTRYTYTQIGSKQFRNLFAFGIKSSYSFKHINESDSYRGEIFDRMMRTRKNWDTMVECLDSNLNYDYKTVYYILHYLRDKRPNYVPKDELVNHLHEMGCKKSDMSAEAIYKELKK